MTRAQAGSIRPVELKEAGQGVSSSAVRASLDEAFADPTGTEELAFQGQKRQLVEGVDQAQLTTEFQAIDDDRRIGEADMLWPQVAVSLDDTALLDSVFEHRGVLLDATPHAVERVADLRLRPG